MPLSKEGKREGIMRASLTRACATAALTALIAIGTGGSGTAFAEDTPTQVNADQDGNPIPQAPDDTDVTVPQDGNSTPQTPDHADGCPPDPGFRFYNVKGTFVGDKNK